MKLTELQLKALKTLMFIQQKYDNAFNELKNMACVLHTKEEFDEFFSKTAPNTINKIWRQL